MKTKLLIFCIALNATQLFAQENNPRIGIKGGLNLSNLYTNDVEKENVRIGYHFGVFAKLPLNDHFAIQPEALFSTKGAKLTYQNSFLEGVGKFNLDYVDVPVLAVFNITSTINFHIGPYFGFLMSSSVSNDTEGSTLFDFENELSKDDFNKTDMGVCAGVGIDFSNLSIGGRYNYGLNKVGKERSFLGQSYVFPDAKNSYIQFYVALGIL